MRRTVWAERKLQDKCLSRESDAKRRRHYLGGCRPAFRVRGTRGISQAVNPPVLGHTCVLALAVVLAAVPGAAQVPSTEKPSTQRPPTEATPPQTEGGTIQAHGLGFQSPACCCRRVRPRSAIRATDAGPPRSHAIAHSVRRVQ